MQCQCLKISPPGRLCIACNSVFKMPFHKLSNPAVKTAYVKSYLNGLPWNDVFDDDDDILNFLDKIAAELNSRTEIVFWTLLTNTCALMGPDSEISISASHKLQSNIYSVIVPHVKHRTFSILG